MSASRAEILHDHLVQLFEAITPANGYRTEVKRVVKYLLDPQKMTQSPSICILFGDETFDERWMPDNWKQDTVTFTTFVPVEVVALAKRSDLDTHDPYEVGAALLHDIKRVVVDLLGRNVADSTNRWVVLPKSVRFTHPVVRENDQFRLIGVGTRFTVQIQVQDKSW